MTEGLKGERFDHLALHGGKDPDMPDLSPDYLLKVWEVAKPELSLSAPVGRIIIIGTKGKANKNLTK